MQMDLLCCECGAVKTPPLALWFEDVCCRVWHMTVGCPLCALPTVRAVCCLSVLMGVWTVTVTSLAAVLVCVLLLEKWGAYGPLANCWVSRLAVQMYWSVWHRGCSIATLLTVSFHRWCMLALFLCFVSFDALGLSSLCMYCGSVFISFLMWLLHVSLQFFTPIHWFILPCRHGRHFSFCHECSILYVTKTLNLL